MSRPYKLCEACMHKYYETVIRECPKKPGHWICQYCCRKCKRSYQALTGRGCKAWDKEHKEREGHE